MSKKSGRPPVDIEIQLTEDETNSGGKEPSKKLLRELAQSLGRKLAKQQLAAEEARSRELSARCRELSDACDDLLNSVIVTNTDVPKSDEK
jgi:hypothetical protein